MRRIPAKGIKKRGMTEGDVTRLLGAAGAGDRAALDRLYVQVYDELRRLAEARLRRERAGHTLQPTALVNEAYLRLSPADSAWENRRHFFGAAAQAMRRILVDHARQKLADKRDGGARVTLADLDIQRARGRPRHPRRERCARSSWHRKIRVYRKS